MVSNERWQSFVRGELPLERLLGGWATFEDVTTRRIARERLAISDRYKKNVDVVVEIELREPLPARVGIVGPQRMRDGTQLPGGGNQVWFSVKGSELARYVRVVGGRNLK